MASFFARFHLPIRVMHVNSTRSIGGTERMLGHLLPRFDSARFRCCLACFNSPSGATAEWRAAGIELYHLNVDKRLSLLGVARLALLMRRWKPDVLFTYGLRAGLMARAASLAYRRLVMISGQRGIEDWKTPLEVLAERVTSPLVDLYVGNSQACCEMLATRERIPRRKLIAIPNGVALAESPDLDVRLADLKRRHPLPDDAFVIGSVGRLAPVKGHDVLIKAARIALRQRGDLFFVFVGEDCRNGELQAMAEREGVGNRCLFGGYTPDVYPWLRRFHLFVLPSLSEGMPVALLEAMLAGLPVIATRVGGVPEVVEHGVSGLLVGPRDPQALADAILALAENSDARKQMAEAGRARASENFTLPTMVRRYEDTILRLVAQKLDFSCWQDCFKEAEDASGICT